MGIRGSVSDYHRTEPHHTGWSVALFFLDYSEIFQIALDDALVMDCK